MTLTASRLREALSYEPTTGEFLRKANPRGGFPAGAVAGTRQANGRVYIRVDGKSYLAHRLAWLYVYGQWPANHIDHINGLPYDNRIANLRDVSRSVNLQNRRSAASNSLTGVLGVSPSGRKFRAHIRIGKEKRYLGTFETLEQAHQIYLEVKRQLHSGCTI